MEYRRKRKTGLRKRTFGRSGSFRSTARSGSGIGTLFSLLMVIGIVYFVSASAAGTWIAENVMAPVIKSISGGLKNIAVQNSDVSPETDTLSAAVDLTAGSAKNTLSREITLPSLSCHMLQMGVYSSAENAKAQAELLRAQGAGGYIMEDSSSGTLRYRVMASGYSTEESAGSVKTRLLDEGVDCTVHSLSSSAATFRVTAAEEKLSGIETGFAALTAAEAALGDAAIRFDKEALSVEEGISLAASIRSTLNSDVELLLSLDADDTVLPELLSAYRDIEASLGTLISGSYENRVPFSSQLKYTHLFTAHRYAQLISSLQ